NALKVSTAVRAGIERLAQTFPEGVTQIIPFDTTRFVQQSIREVIITLSEAAFLVLLVVFVFLQSWRATLIPIIAVPVSLIGGFAGKLYQQFAVTVATAVTISGVVALTLTPALCALLLKPQHIENRLFRPFNRGFAWLTRFYLASVRITARHRIIALLVFAGILGVDALLFRTVPGGFVPPE